MMGSRANELVVEVAMSRQYHECQHDRFEGLEVVSPDVLRTRSEIPPVPRALNVVDSRLLSPTSVVNVR